jgi:hypothetical protein
VNILPRCSCLNTLYAHFEQQEAAINLSRVIKACADLRANDEVRDAMRAFDMVMQNGERSPRLPLFNFVHADHSRRK